jgi:hypothetical protein
VPAGGPDAPPPPGLPEPVPVEPLPADVDPPPPQPAMRHTIVDTRHSRQKLSERLLGRDVESMRFRSSF